MPLIYVYLLSILKRITFYTFKFVGNYRIKATNTYAYMYIVCC